MTEASRLVREFDDLERRHATEIQDYRIENPIGTGSLSLETWTEHKAMGLLFEQSEPEIFNYDFHMLRKQFLESVDSGGRIKIGETFFTLCGLTGISGLYNSELSARQILETIYDGPTNPREEPKISCMMMSMLELDIVNLRLYLAARDFYGAEGFLALLEGSLVAKTPDIRQPRPGGE